VKHGRTQGLILRTVIWIENWANLASFFLQKIRDTQRIPGLLIELI